MIKEKRFLIPVIVLYVILAAVLVFTAIYPKADYAVSDALTGSAFTYTIGNFIEIWAEPLTLVPMCFILAASVVYCIRRREKKIYIVLGAALTVGGAVLSYQVIHRIVKYYSRLTDITKPWTVSEGPSDLWWVKAICDAAGVKFFSDVWWVNAICAAAGVLMMFLFLFLASKFDRDILANAGRVLAFCVISLLAELAVIEGLKLFFGRMRYREWINTDQDIYPWYRINGKPVSDAYKDAYKSFPSGHTANGFLLMPMTFVFDAFGKKHTGNVLRICHLVWMCVLMTSRIMAGAHFLSDVAAGMLISLTIVVVTGSVIFRDGKISK